MGHADPTQPQGVGAVLRRAWSRLGVVRVTVSGSSMAPCLLEGDRLLVSRGAPARPGAIVAVRDPRSGRLLVKRVASIDPGGVVVHGDNADHSTDSRHFGPVAANLVVGRALWRYAPPERAGRINSPP